MESNAYILEDLKIYDKYVFIPDGVSKNSLGLFLRNNAVYMLRNCNREKLFVCLSPGADYGEVEAELGFISRNIIKNTDSLEEAIKTLSSGSNASIMVFVHKIHKKTFDEISNYTDVYRINEEGYLIKIDSDDEQAWIQEKKINKEAAKPFHFSKEFTRIKWVQYNTKEDNPYTVFDENGKVYRVIEKQNSNNGGNTFSTNEDGLWIKIFDKELRSSLIEAKIRRMVSYQVECEGVCWPLHVAFDSQGMFCGYFIKSFSGYPLNTSVFRKTYIEKRFPNWDRRDLCTLAITILKKIEVLHKNSVLMGCINPAAIRVVDQNTVYFIDTDNYQVEDFPSIYNVVSFTPPEHLDDDLYMLSQDSENFAIAELVFMIMMPGKNPYLEGVIGNNTTEIKKMDFKYAYKDKKRNDQSIPGPWRFSWSHLTPLKEPFYETFQKGEKHNSVGSRLDVGYWINRLDQFRKELNYPQNEKSRPIFPATYKIIPGEKTKTCMFCYVTHPLFYFSNQYGREYNICNSCLNDQSDISFTCQCCGKIYYYTNRTALYHERQREKNYAWKDQKWCSNCKSIIVRCKGCNKEKQLIYLNKKGYCADCVDNSICTYIKCKDCGKTFGLTVKEKKYYDFRDWEYPKRCPSCRKMKNNHYWDI